MNPTLEAGLAELQRKLEQREGLIYLVGTILSTLSLPENAKHPISKLSDIDVLQGWKKKFEELSKES